MLSKAWAASTSLYLCLQADFSPGIRWQPNKENLFFFFADISCVCVREIPAEWLLPKLSFLYKQIQVFKRKYCKRNICLF